MYDTRPPTDMNPFPSFSLVLHYQTPNTTSTLFLTPHAIHHGIHIASLLSSCAAIHQSGEQAEAEAVQRHDYSHPQASTSHPSV